LSQRKSFFPGQDDAADLAKGTAHFTQGDYLDPGSAQAYANLSQAQFYLGLFGMGPAGELFPKGRRAP